MTKNIEQAKMASLKAYVPYSDFRVGCAIEMNNGDFILGTNIENASYSATICAERSAISQLISTGLNPKNVKSVTVYNKDEKLCSPCGICRQVLVELLAADTSVVISNENKELSTTVSELLPFAFDKGNLSV